MNLLFSLISMVFAQDTSFSKDEIIIEDYPYFNAQSFRPSIDSQSFFWVTDSSLLHNKYMYKVLFVHTDSPLVYTDPNGEEYQVLEQINELDLIGSYRYKKLRVGVSLPLFVKTFGLLNQQLTQSVTEDSLTENTYEETKFGDIMVDTKLQLLENPRSFFGLATSARLTLPTSTSSLPLGSDGAMLELELNADKKISNLRLAANVGTRIASDVELSDALNQTWGSGTYSRWGLSHDLKNEKGLSLEYINGMMLNQNIPASNEALFSFWTPWEQHIVKTGVSIGVSEGIGTPRYRFLISLEPHSVLEIDSDRDTVVDAYDVCPTEIEDIDGVLDSDGCYDDENTKTPVFAIGDLQADLENAQKAFRLAGIIDEEDNWLLKDIVVIQIGDILDHTHPSDELLKWLKKMEYKAMRNNSTLYVLLGSGDLDMIQNNYSVNLSEKKIQTNPEKKKKEETTKRPNAVYRDWILRFDPVVIEEDVLFSHGGISVNNADDPKILSEDIRKAIETKQNSNFSPLNHQEYWTEVEDKACFEVDVVLDKTNTSRMITSHPDQVDGRIKMRCNGRLIDIDTGISQYYDGEISALKIEGNTITAIYPDKTEILVENNKVIVPLEESSEDPDQEESPSENEPSKDTPSKETPSENVSSENALSKNEPSSSDG